MGGFVKAKYEPSETLRDWSESKASRANGVRKAAKRSREVEAREEEKEAKEAKEAKRRRLIPVGFPNANVLLSSPIG